MALQAQLANGWIVVPYSGPELTLIEIGIAGDWKPAYLDWHNGQRVAQIRIPPGRGMAAVALRAAGIVTPAGKLDLSGQM